MIRKSLSYLITGAFALFIAQCQSLEFSKFEDGNAGDTNINGSNQGQGVPFNENSEAPSNSEADSLADSSSFGLTPCVKEYLENNNRGTYEPPKTASSLSDFIDIDSIRTYEQFLVLGNLILGEVVEPNSGFVNYSALRGQFSSQWKALIKGLSILKPDSLSTDQKISYWTNAYNLSMIQFIVNNPSATRSNLLVGSEWEVFDTKIPDEIGGNNNVSLNGIETGILRLGETPKQPFPNEEVVQRKEPKLHVALVCGAVACPKLRNFMYPNNSADLSQILQENLFLFFNDFNQVRVSGSNTSISSLFASWYKEDFLRLSGGNLGNLSQYVLSECRNDKAVIDSSLRSSDLAEWGYNWVVNDIKNI